MMKRIPVVVWILVVSAPLFFGANSPQAPLLITDASKAFISSVTQTNYGDRLSRVVVPNPGKLAGELFCDLPCAVHVPFEVPYQGMLVRVYHEVSIFWERGNYVMGGSDDIANYGLYRLDGKRLPDNTVMYEDNPWPSPKDWKPLWFDAAAPVPCWINGTPPPKPAYQMLSVRHYNTADEFKAASLARDMPRPLLLKQAVAGWYGFWFAVPSWNFYTGWPQNLDSDTVHVTLRVSLLVTSAVPSGIDDLVAYFFHGGPRPKSMADDSFYRAYNIDVPVTLTRNGWVFDHAEIESWKKEVDQKQLSQDELVTAIQAQTKAAGPLAKLSLRTTTTKDQRVICQDAYDWEATFPPSIPDGGVADVLIGGSEDHQWANDKGWSDKPLLLLPWNQTELNDPDSPYRFCQIVSTGCKWPANDSTFTRADGSRLELAAWWFDDPRPREQAPGGNAPPLRYRYSAHSPDYSKFPGPSIGLAKIIKLSLGPWKVTGVYRRRSEAGPQLTHATGPATATTVVGEKDLYWEWLDKFRALKDDNESRVAVIRIRLARNSKEIQRLRRKWFTLLYLDQLSYRLGPDDDLLSRIPFRSAFTQATLQQMKADRDQLQADMAARRAEQEPLVQQGVRLMKVIAESAEGQAIASRDHAQHRAMVQKTIDRCQDQLALTKLDLYDVAGQSGIEGLQKAIAECEFSSKSVREVAGLMAAKLARLRVESFEEKLRFHRCTAIPVPPNNPVEQQAQAARFDELRALQEVLKLNPNNPTARIQHQERELEMLGWIAAKLEYEKHLSWAGFQRYLTARGYSAETPKDSWDVANEYRRVWWGSGPTSLGAGLPWTDTAAAVADITTLDQENIAKNQVSLLAIKHLCRAGLTVQQVRELAPDELGRQMTLRTSEGQPLAQAKARQLLQDLHETFAELYDLRALAEGDPESFRTFFARNYYESFDPTRTWPEATVDFLFSPSGLCMASLSSSIVRLNGQWLPLSAPSASELRLLEEAGQVVRTRELFVSTLRLQQLGDYLAKEAPVWRGLRDAVIADQQFLENLNGINVNGISRLKGLEQFLNSGSRLAATIAIYGGSAQLAEQSGVPGLTVLVDVLAMLGPGEITSEILARSRTPIEKLQIAVEAYGALLTEARAQLAVTEQAIARLERLTEAVSSSGSAAARLTETEINEIETISKQFASTEPAPTVPGTNPQDDLHTALTSAAQALEKGDAAEAKRALDFAKTTSATMRQTVEGGAKKVQQVRIIVKQKPALRQVPPPQQFQIIKKTGNPKPFVPEGGYPPGDHGILLRQGDEALRRGELDSASKFYRQAQEEAQKNGFVDTENLIDDRLALAEHARDLQQVFDRLRATKAPLPVDEPITVDKAGDILQGIKTGDLTPTGPVGSANPVYFLKDKNGKTQYVFKAIKQDNAVELDLERFASAATTALKEELGYKAAACQRIALPDEIKKILPRGVTCLDEGLLFRYIEGQPVWNLTEPVIVAIKRDYAKQRVLRLWFGDTDGHLGNLRVGSDGRMAPLDFGFTYLKKDLKSDFQADIGHRHFTPEEALGRDLHNQEDMLKAVLAFPDYIVKANPGHASLPLYTWIQRLDGMLHYEDMGSTVDAIKKLCTENNGKRLRDILEATLPAGEVEEAFQVLRERASALDKVLQEKFLPPIQTSWLQPGRSPRALAQTAAAGPRGIAVAAWGSQVFCPVLPSRPAFDSRWCSARASGPGVARWGSESEPALAFAA